MFTINPIGEATRELLDKVSLVSNFAIRMQDMPKQKITYQVVKAAIDLIKDAGVVPTIDNIHRAFDFNADKKLIKLYLKEWREKEQGTNFEKLGLNKNQARQVQKILESRTQQLEESINLYRATLECSTDGILVVNNQGKMVDYNERFRKMWNVPREYLEARNDKKAIEHVMGQCTDPEAFLENTMNIYDDEEGEGRVADIELKSGHIFERYSLPQKIGDDVVGRVWANRDVTGRRAVEDELRLQKQAIEASPNGVIIIEIDDQKNPVVYANPAFTQVTGYTAKEMQGHTIYQLVKKDLNQPDLLKLKQAIKEERSERVELRSYRKDGTMFWNELHIAPVLSSGKEFNYEKKLFVNENDENVSKKKATHFVAIIIDITARKAMEEQLLHQATHDILTDLPNRALLQDRVERAISRAKREDNNCAVLFLDIDNFKLINDGLGHNIGDELICKVSNRIRNCLRETDTVARLGGDEFVIVLSPLRNVDNSIDVTKNILDAVRQPFQLQNRELNITSSIGVGCYPKDGENYEELIRNADTAMYQAKDNGRDNFQFFTAGMNEKVSSRLKLQNALRGALQRNEFHLVYQPITDVKTEQMVGVETLLRWSHPELGQISPAIFVPLAEETGLIIEIGQWIIEQSCKQIVAWQSQGLPPIQVAINLSGRQLKHTDIVKTLADIIKKTKVDPKLLVIELTESMLMDNTEETIQKLNEIKKMGILIAIDDFGTGYSSLSYLTRLPVDKLKIDRAFVAEITNLDNDSTIIKTIIAMAKNLNLKVVAEGAEAKAEIDFLKEADCDEIQGYYYSKPLDPRTLALYLEKNCQSA